MPFHPLPGPANRLRSRDAAGLTRFGTFVETMPRGDLSSLCLWHEAQDGFVSMPTGKIIARKGGTAPPQTPGEAVCFKTGVSVGHYLENRRARDAGWTAAARRARP